MQTAGRVLVTALISALAVSGPAKADLSLFVGTVSFDKAANLESAPSFGLRWGRSGATIGGETSLMISRPSREISSLNSKETATSIFYEGRFLLNFPTGQLKPFVGVGFGAVTVTSTDLPTELPTEVSETASQALATATDLQTNSAFSYGGGLRFRVADRLDVRLDLRQYQVLSVKGVVEAQLTEQLEELTGTELPPTKDNTVQYNEATVGLVINF